MTRSNVDRHVWITGSSRDRRREAAANQAPSGERLDVAAHRRLRGPYTAAGTILRHIIPALIPDHAELVQRHDVEILTAAPELDGLIVNRRVTLTSMAAPDERTRFYPRAHTRRIAHGLCELLLAWARLHDDPPILFLDRVDTADETDRELAEIMLRRSDPRVLKLIVGTTPDPSLDPTLTQVLERHCQVVSAPTPTPESAHTTILRSTQDLAHAYVESDCTSEDEAQELAYQSLSDEGRAILHDRRADELDLNQA